MAEPLDEAALVAKLRTLPPERQEQVRAFVDFLAGQEPGREEGPGSQAVSEALSRKVRASLDAAMRGGQAGADSAPDEESQQKALEELARRFPPDGAEEAL